MPQITLRFHDWINMRAAKILNRPRYVAAMSVDKSRATGSYFSTAYWAYEFITEIKITITTKLIDKYGEYTANTVLASAI